MDFFRKAFSRNSNQYPTSGSRGRSASTSSGRGGGATPSARAASASADSSAAATATGSVGATGIGSSLSASLNSPLAVAMAETGKPFSLQSQLQRNRRPDTELSARPVHSSLVHFQVYADQHICDSERGDRVVLLTSIPNMPRILLETHPNDPRFWVCQVELPFASTERCPSGLMQYRFEIVTHDEKTFPEMLPLAGVRSRVMVDVQRYICSEILLPPSHPRSLALIEFRTSNQSIDFSSFPMFVTRLLNDFNSGLVMFPDIWSRYIAITTAFASQCTARATESIVDRFIDNIRPDQEWHPLLSYLLFGICGLASRYRDARPDFPMSTSTPFVGHYSTSEHIRLNGDSERPANMSSLHNLTPPKSISWCAHLLPRIDCKSLYLMPHEFATQFGTMNEVQYIVDGVHTAINRLSQSHSSSLLWLRFVPLLMRKGIAPSVVFRESIDTSVLDEYASLKDNLLTEILACFSSCNEEHDVALYSLGVFWLRTLIRCAPSIKCLVDLVQPCDGHWIQLDEDSITICNGLVQQSTLPLLLNSYQSGSHDFNHCVVAELATWLSSQSHLDDSMLEMLAKLISVAKILGCARIGAMVVLHTSVDGASLEPLLHVLSLCATIPNRGPLQASVPAQVHDEELRSLCVATQLWFARCHCQSSSATGIEPGVDSELLLLAQSLQHSIDVLNSVFKISIFGRDANFMLCQLSKCAPLRRDQLTVLQVIGRVSLNTVSLSSCNESIQKYFSTLTDALVRQLMCSHDRLALVKLVLNSFGESLLCDSLLTILVTDLTQTDSVDPSRPTLMSLLRNVDVWVEILTARGVDLSTWRTGASSTLKPAANITVGQVQYIFQQLGCGSINLRELRILRKEMAATLKLINVLSGSVTQQIASKNQFDRALATLAQYESLTQHVSCYVNSFGFNFDVRELKQRMQDFNDCERRSSLTLLQISNFAEEVRPFGNSLAWLYELRDSVLLRRLWVTSSAFRTQMSQQQVINELIPTVKLEWDSLWSEIRKKTILITRLRETFGVLLKHFQSPDSDGSNECCLELDLMNRTGSFCAKPTEMLPTVELDELKRCFCDFVKVESAGQRLPSFVQISKLLTSILHARNKQSAIQLSGQLNQVLDLLQTDWGNWSTSTLSQARQTAALFSSKLPQFTVLQSNFLLLLSNCEALVLWLLNQAEESDFNRLLQVCRSCTDDALALSSIASLIYIRTLLKDFLFPVQPYADTSDMLFRFCSVDVDGLTGYSHLQNLEASFITLKTEFIDKQTRSDGIQALMDLNQLKNSSKFVIQFDDSISPSMTLHLETKGAGSKIKMESIHYLQDLRSKLLITDVPEHMELEFGMTAMRDAFATQLQILIEIRDQVLQLQTLGHFEFQTYVSRWDFDVARGLVSLLKERKLLVDATQSWIQLVSSIRSKFYFLNYFTMRELLHLSNVFGAIRGSASAAAVADICSHLHLISSRVDIEDVKVMLTRWTAPIHSAAGFIELFGVALENLLRRDSTFVFSTRPVPIPSQNVSNLHDMLISVQDQATVPVFCAVTPNSSFTESDGVLASVLSIFLRRGRLPEPGEILFCSSKTTEEDVELLLRRFIRARSFGRKDSVFVLANVQSLSYATQSAAVSILRDMLSTGSQHRDASILAMVSAKPAQLLLTAFSAQSIELPALDINSIRDAMRGAALKHNGPLTCVASSINGGGKSDYIMRHVAQLQMQNQALMYHRVFIRESTGADALVTDLLTSKASSRAIHIDIGHIAPESVNVTLFELLIVGVLKSVDHAVSRRALSRVYHRVMSDCIYVEIPNSVQDKSRCVLRVLSFFDTQQLTVDANSLKLDQPRFVGSVNCSKLQLVARPEITFVGKMLRAIQNGALKPDANGTVAMYKPASDGVNIVLQDCFNLCVNVCSPGMQPNWTVMSSFLNFMTPAFQTFLSYSGQLNIIIKFATKPEVKQLQHIFAALLIETSKDFSIRSVPRPDKCIPSIPALQPRLLHRNSSGSRNSNRHREQMAAAASDQSRELVREQSESAVNRFGSMKLWHDTDHPVLVWHYDAQGSPANAKILSLNPQYLGNFMSKSLVDTLTMQGFKDLGKDWQQMTSAEGEEIIRSVHSSGNANAANVPLPAGFVVPRITPGYVVTIDNLMKMLAVQLRICNRIPVVIMGETGCGKSSLVNSMCSLLKIPLFTLNIHGGMEDSDILLWMLERVELARKHPNVKVVVFLDEVNTCNSMCLFKEIICDRCINGTQLPSNMDIIAACNPYRRKQGLGAEQEKSAGLMFNAAADENVGSGITDPLQDLVYRVHPLPESLTDLVFDFGALQASTEKLYIKSMVRAALSAVRAAAVEPNLGDQQQQQQQQRRAELNALQSEAQNCFASIVRDNMVIEDLWNAHNADFERLRNSCSGHVDAQQLIADVSQQCSVAFFQCVMDARSALDDNSASVMRRISQFISSTQPVHAPAVDMLNFVNVLSELICASQEFVRHLHGGERSVCSLRDVARFLAVFSWFGRHFVKMSPGTCTEAEFFGICSPAFGVIRQAVIMALTYCYMSRLPGEHRSKFLQCISETWKRLKEAATSGPASGSNEPVSKLVIYQWFQPNVPEINDRCCSWMLLSDPNSFQHIITDVQRSLVQHIRLSDGIALNDALLENLFMILVSIFNRFPIFIVGKPGSSKSLAVQLIQSSFRGRASENEVLRSLPAVEVFSYQCSPLSTSAGIQQVFETAARYKKSTENCCVVVLLDEVGLAEQSPHLPLKVLHKILDENSGGCVVGISNWSLDPAKMNRAAHLYRPAPTKQDLSNTAEGMVRSVNLKGYLQALAAAYFDVYQNQKEWGFEDFWGLREFYSTIKAINRHLRQPGNTLDAAAVMSAVQRNFGGRPEVMRQVVETFFASLNLGVVDDIPVSSVVQLIEQNIFDPDARHLLILTKNNVALGVLFDLYRQTAVDVPLLTHARTEVIFGSEFPMDQSDLQISLNLQKIKTCMATGKLVVLVHCEQLYESLYDLLNQHYISVKSQNFVRIAFGSHSRLCPIHRDFRIICIVETNDAYQNLAPPFLNRFEKQVLERKDLISPIQQSLIDRLRFFVKDLLPETGLVQLQSTFCGYHSDLIASLVQAVTGDSWQSSQEEQNSLFRDAVLRLFWIAQPEAICRVLADQERYNNLASKYHIDVRQIYFDQQVHTDFSALVCRLLSSNVPDFTVLTHSPFEVNLKSVLVKNTVQGTRVTTCSLHDLSSERDLKKEVDAFFAQAARANSASLFVLQCDLQSSSVRLIQHSRYIIDNIRSQYPGLVNCRVLILLHLSRVNGSYALDPDKRWSHAYVDCIEPASESGFLSLVELTAATSMSLIISRLDLKLVLRRCFRTSVARLIYPYQRSVADVRKQISFLLRRLRDHDDALLDPTNRTDLKNQSFLQIVQALITNIVADSKMQLDMSAAVDDTFQAALHSQIDQAVVSSFAILLAEMDRNSNLRLLALHDDAVSVRGASAITDEQRQLSSIWLSLLPMYDQLRAMKRESLTLAAKVTDVSRLAKAVEVVEDGAGSVRFVAQFPFSFYLAPIVNNMRVAAEMQPPETRVAFTQGMIAKLSVPELFKRGTALSSSLIQRYVHDLICMYVEHSASYTIDTEFAIVWRMLFLVGNCAGTQAEPTTLAAVHCRFWAIQQRVYLYLQLLQIVPAASSALISLLQQSHCVSLHLDCLVIKTIIDFQLQSSSTWQSAADYHDWLRALQLTDPRASALLAFASNSSDGALLVNDACAPLQADMRSFESLAIKLDEKMSKRNIVLKSSQFSIDIAHFLDAFVRHVCHELRLEPKVSLPLVQSLIRQSRNKLRSLATFQLLFSSLRDLYAQVNASDIEARNRFRHCASKVTEAFIFETCFGGSDLGSNLGSDLLKACVPLLATSTGENHFLHDHNSVAGVLTSTGSQVALMRSLLSINEPAAKAAIDSSLLEVLKSSISQFGYMDTPVVVAYGIVQEAKCLNATPTLSDALEDSYLTSIDLEMLVDLRAKSIRASLDCIAKTRHLLNLFAASIDSCFSNSPNCDDRAFIFYVSQRLSSILSVHHPKSIVTRPAALYLLKQLNRRRGDSFVRSFLLDVDNDPAGNCLISTSDWVVAWMNSGDKDLISFLSAGKMPRLNPLQTLPLWQKVSVALEQVLNTDGNCAALESVASENKMPALKGALLGCIFHRIYMSKVISVTLAHSVSVQKWIAESASLAWLHPAERQLMLFFAGGPCPPHLSEEARNYLLLDKHSSLERISTVRLLVHFAACAMSVPSSHPLSIFRTLFTRPSLLKNNPLPTMPEDELAMAVQVLGGRWYRCANGHPFFVDACGRPTEEITCTACGIKIGGLDHRADHGIVDVDKNLGNGYFQKTSAVDNSPSGYCIKRVADEAHKLLSVRGVPPIGMRFQRFCLHSALLLGCVATTGSESLNSVVFQRDLVNSAHALNDGSDPAAHFVRHLQADWSLSVQLVDSNVDNVFNLFHLSLRHCCSASVDSSMRMVDCQGFAVFGTAAAGYTQRNAFEQAINSIVIKPMFTDPGIANRLDQAVTLFQTSAQNDGGAVFVSKLRDRIEFDLMHVSVRLLMNPVLWSFRQRFSLSEMIKDLNPQLHPDTAQQFPVLSLILSQRQESHVRSLRYTPQIFDFSNLLLNKYSRRLDRISARSMNISDELSTALDGRMWRFAFDAFRDAFNGTWRHVSQIECEPNHNPDLLVSEQTSIAMCLPYRSDEGLYLSAGVAASLGTLHNEIVSLTAQRLGTNESTIVQKSSTLFTSADAISFDFDEFTRFVEGNCVQFGDNGSVSIDYSAAEQHLMSRYIFEKPRFKIECRTMVFISSIDSQSGARVDSDVQISRVDVKVQQHSLSPQFSEQLLAEISLPVARKNLLNLLETVVSLLQETGGDAQLDVGSTRLVEFLESDLQLSSADVLRLLCLGASTSLTPVFHTQICLKHIAHVNDLIGGALQACSSVKQSIAESMGISRKYQQHLSDSEKSVLLQQFQAPDLRAAREQILDLMLNVMRASLTAENTDEIAHISDLLRWVEVGDLYAEDLEWFPSFPTYLLCRHFVHVYETIQESLSL